MSRFSSALAISLSLLALAGVGFVLTRAPATPDVGVGEVELDRLFARLIEVEDRLDNLSTRASAGATRASRSAAPKDESGAATLDEENIEFTEGDDPSTDEGTLLARLEAVETRLRGLEEDPVQRAYTFLQSENAELRRRGVSNLRSLAKNDPEARAAVREMLEDSSAIVRAQALEVLADIGDKEAIPIAASLLEDDSVEVRREAIEALTRLEAKDAAADIATFISDEDDKIRWLAVDSVGKLGHKEAADVLVSALEDKNAGIRGEAILSLGEIGATDALPDLREFYKTVTAEGARDAGDHRYRLAYAMKQLGEPEAARAEVLRLGDTVLNGEDDRARGGALRGLVWLGRDDPAGRAILEQVAEGSNDWMRREAKRALNGERGKQAKGR